MHWTSKQIRQTFLDFFNEKKHHIVHSAPLVLQDDDTLLFTNAGMNQFKDYFLGYKEIKQHRIADTQKCLRVSGKHNDLEDVGLDTYHHTFFEMLGNWSFGDYFKEEAISWAWELLTDVFAIEKDRLYVTIFEGDSQDDLEKDTEAFSIWSKFIDKSRILNGNKKDNFWEMGDVGPCGPCSEIHIDLRTQDERNAIDGSTLVNQDHPQVVEVWNLVFMQYNRKANGNLEKLKHNHIDTGMGFERLCMALQGKTSNYDIDLFSHLIAKVESIANTKYTQSMEKKDIAIRVIVDHIRAVAFAIADGQLPSNTSAGYVIRRILRRAVRYGYSFLHLQSPFLFQLVSPLIDMMGEPFPELASQQDFIEKVIQEEEKSFLKTLDSGLKRLENINSDISGKDAFKLYDTYGFPLDLTMLIAKEKGLSVDEVGFEKEMNKQRASSSQDAKVETGDWVILSESSSSFVGYDQLETTTEITRYRTMIQKEKEIYQVVLKETPFYPESGGQVGDKGQLIIDGKSIAVYNTKKESNLIIHYVNSLPSTFQNITAQVNATHRVGSMKNHSATHLLHAALKQVLGDHVQQKGSLVTPDKLRFDFSHFSKLSNDELQKIETIVNHKITENIPLHEQREIPFQEAINQGATALFGEKYGDYVRVIQFDSSFSTELCGGTHVQSTAEIQVFKILAESSSAAGIRRIEAIVGKEAIDYLQDKNQLVSQIGELVKNEKHPLKGVEQLAQEVEQLRKKVEQFEIQQIAIVKQQLINTIETKDDFSVIIQQVELPTADALKNLSFSLKQEIDNVVVILGTVINDKPLLSIMISEQLVNEQLNANKLIRELAKEIKGGGGGQPFYATAGGKQKNGLQAALEMGRELINQL